MSSKQTKIVLKKNKELGGKIWHPDTCLVFRSSSDKTVIGRCVDGELSALDQSCIEDSKKWGFKYDESLLEEVDEVEEEDTESDKSKEEDAEDDSSDEEDKVETPKPSKKDSPKPSKKDSPKPSKKDSPKPSKKDSPKDSNKAVNIVEAVQSLVDEVSSLTNRIADLEKELAAASEEASKWKGKFSAVKAMFS